MSGAIRVVPVKSVSHRGQIAADMKRVLHQQLGLPSGDFIAVEGIGALAGGTGLHIVKHPIFPHMYDKGPGNLAGFPLGSLDLLFIGEQGHRIGRRLLQREQVEGGHIPVYRVI